MVWIQYPRLGVTPRQAPRLKSRATGKVESRRPRPPFLSLRGAPAGGSLSSRGPEAGILTCAGSHRVAAAIEVGDRGWCRGLSVSPALPCPGLGVIWTGVTLLASVSRCKRLTGLGAPLLAPRRARGRSGPWWTPRHGCHRSFEGVEEGPGLAVLPHSVQKRRLGSAHSQGAQTRQGNNLRG